MKIGIVGSTGLVGRTILHLLEESELEIDELHLLSSHRSHGKTIKFRNKDIIVETVKEQLLGEKFDFLFFAAGKDIAKELAPIAEKSGSTVIDNSSAFRKTHPLIVPEINGYEVRTYQGIIANPNCSTIQLVLAINPLHQEYGLKSVIISTYQSVSGSGNTGIEALLHERNTGSYCMESPFTEQIDLNIIPQIGEFDSSGYCEEEHKMHYELRRIISEPNLQVVATTVRVPVITGHSQSIYLECNQDIDLERIADIFYQNHRIGFYGRDYISPLEIIDRDRSYVCRLRKGLNSKSILFWNVADNIRVGAATNAVNIMKYILNTR